MDFENNYLPLSTFISDSIISNQPIELNNKQNDVVFKNNKNTISQSSFNQLLQYQDALQQSEWHSNNCEEPTFVLTSFPVINSVAAISMQKRRHYHYVG